MSGGTITSILLSCLRDRRYFLVIGEEVDDPSKFKWINDYERALATARNVYDTFKGRKRVRVYDVDDGQYVYDVGRTEP